MARTPARVDGMLAARRLVSGSPLCEMRETAGEWQAVERLALQNLWINGANMLVALATRSKPSFASNSTTQMASTSSPHAALQIAFDRIAAASLVSA